MHEVQTFLRKAWAAAERAIAAIDEERRRNEAAKDEERRRNEAAKDEERRRNEEIARRAAKAAALAEARAAAEAQRLRRNTASAEYAGNGATLGGILLGLAGCVSCLANLPQGRITDFNLFTGVLFGAVLGAILGIAMAQTKD